MYDVSSILTYLKWYGGFVLGLSQFLPMAKSPFKMLLTSKVVKNDPKLITLMHLLRLNLNP